MLGSALFGFGLRRMDFDSGIFFRQLGRVVTGGGICRFAFSLVVQFQPQVELLMTPGICVDDSRFPAAWHISEKTIHVHFAGVSGGFQPPPLLAQGMGCPCITAKRGRIVATRTRANQ